MKIGRGQKMRVIRQGERADAFVDRRAQKGLKENGHQWHADEEEDERDQGRLNDAISREQACPALVRHAGGAVGAPVCRGGAQSLKTFFQRARKLSSSFTSAR